MRVTQFRQNAFLPLWTGSAPRRTSRMPQKKIVLESPWMRNPSSPQAAAAAHFKPLPRSRRLGLRRRGGPVFDAKSGLIFDAGIRRQK